MNQSLAPQSSNPPNAMSSDGIHFIRRGERVTLQGVPPERTLLQVLREDLGATGTKEGCNEGDCGACTVVLGEPTADGGIRLRAVNSCIRLAHSVNGLAVWTAQDIHQDPLVKPVEPAPPAMPRAQPAAAPDADLAALHPAQACLVQCHASQCGFCTPGFVMSLFAHYHEQVWPEPQAQVPTTLPGAPPALPPAPPPVLPLAVSRTQAQEVLSGNLCRCTGYRPILDAAQVMPQAPRWRLDAAALRQRLDALAEAASSAHTRQASASPATAATQLQAARYLSAKHLAQLLQARAAYPQAQVVAGCTDVGLWVNKQHRVFEQILDVTRTQELLRVEVYPQHIAIGAAVSLTDAYAALVAERPQLHDFASRFAGLPVRNSGTLGGNVANGSPIGDSMPLLIALGASVVLMRWQGQGARGQLAHRELALEDFYLGYRRTALRPDELLAWIKVPRPVSGEFLQVHKLSKRFDDDISAVCLGVFLQLDTQGRIAQAKLGAGGVAATPVRARRTEAHLVGQAWTMQTAQRAAATLQAEFQPISDMRASASYRSTMLGELLVRAARSLDSHNPQQPWQLDSASASVLADLAAQPMHQTPASAPALRAPA